MKPGIIYIRIALAILFLPSCKKFIEVSTPDNQLISATVFTNDATATSATLGMYLQMSSQFSSIFNGGTSLYAGLSSDELLNTPADISREQFFSNSLIANLGILKSTVWDPAYKYIYQANLILEGLSGSTVVSANLKKQLEGEAKFVRALSHFYLANLFGSVPLVTSTDYRINMVASRSQKDQVYQQIVSDLKEAQMLLSNDYVGANNAPATDRLRPNTWVATALLARVYLYAGDWVNAEALATTVISNTTLYTLENNLNNVFLKNSRETIWQILPVSTNSNTAEGAMFAYTSGIPAYASLTNSMVNAFETGDNRKVNWVYSYAFGSQTYYQPYKYKVRSSATLTEYNIVLRLAEQYLIRAEARIRQNNIPGAQADINAIRTRAGLGNTPAADSPSLLSAIEQERKVELFAEFGHRWLDLKRTNRANAVLSIVKGSNWQPTDVLYPVPQPDILNNANLLPQNPGY